MELATHSIQIITMMILPREDNTRSQGDQKTRFCVPNILIARIVVARGLVTFFRPIYPLQRILHQPDNCSAIPQLLDI